MWGLKSELSHQRVGRYGKHTSGTEGELTSNAESEGGRGGGEEGREESGVFIWHWIASATDR